MDFLLVISRIAPSTSSGEGISSSGAHMGHCLVLSATRGSRVGDLALRSCATCPLYLLLTRLASRSTLPSLSLMLCEVTDLLAPTAISFMCS